MDEPSLSLLPKPKQLSLKDWLITEIRKAGMCKNCQRLASERFLTFHHREEESKRCCLGDNRTGLIDALRELPKCDLLCEPCHRFIHRGIKVRVWQFVQTKV